MKPIKDAKATVRGLGADELDELDAVEPPPPSSRAVNAIPPQSSIRPGAYAHLPPRRNTRELAAIGESAAKSERGGTLRPPAPSVTDET